MVWNLRHRLGAWKTTLLLLMVVGLGTAPWHGATLLAAVQSPYRFLQTLGSNVDLEQARPFASGRRDYSYEISPLAKYVEFEKMFVDFDETPIMELAESLAEDTAFDILTATDRSNIEEAEVTLWQAGKGRRVMEKIAQGLREADVYYEEESLLSRSFDPELHDSTKRHLDCDLLAHFFVHVGSRLDLDIREVSSPLHAYLVYNPPEGVEGEPIFVEPTEFRSPKMLLGLGDDFFIPEDFHRKGGGGIVAAPSVIETAGYYRPMAQRDLEDSIALNVLHGVERMGYRTQELVWSVRVRSELEARVAGTRQPGVVTNLYVNYLDASERARLNGNPELALEEARKAEELRRRHGDLLLHHEPRDQLAIARSLLLMEEGEAAGEVLERVRGWYGARLGASASRVVSDVHAEFLVLAATTRPTLGVEEYETLLLPVIEFERSLRERMSEYGTSERLRRAFLLSAKALRGTKPGLAREYADLADRSM